MKTLIKSYINKCVLTTILINIHLLIILSLIFSSLSAAFIFWLIGGLVGFYITATNSPELKKWNIAKTGFLTIFLIFGTISLSMAVTSKKL